MPPASHSTPVPDYMSLLKALVPQVLGFYCYDHLGRLFWHVPAENCAELTLEYEHAVTAVLKDSEQTPKQAIALDDGIRAYFFATSAGEKEPHGAISVIVNSDPAPSPAAMGNVLGPVLRTMDRELTLRRQRVRDQRNFKEQAKEENFLDTLESIVPEPGKGIQSLEKILLISTEQLGIEQISLSIPDRDIKLSKVKDMENSPDPVRTSIEDTDHDSVTLPVGTSHSQGPALLMMSGWANTGLGENRWQRLARNIASKIESVIAQDYDELTGLLSWPRFEAELEVACLSPQREDHLLMYLDVDRLTVINENYGRHAGDRMLSELSKLLVEKLSGHSITRIAGDRFAVLLPDTPMSTARKSAEEIAAKFSQLRIGNTDGSINPAVSIGLGPLADDEKGAGSSLAAAQVACQAAKDRGRGRVECYEVEHPSIIRRLDDIQLVGNVQAAILGNRLRLVGQPITTLNGTSDLHYMEILVRMLNENGDPVAPEAFLPAAERFQLMQELDRWVLSNSLRQLCKAGLHTDTSPVKLAINLSGQSLGNEKFMEFAEKAIIDTKVAPQLLCFEITESVAMANLQRAQDFMRHFMQMGCSFSLDDFGTGLSSFAYLKLFPVDTLKIDGSFVEDITGNKVSQAVVAAIAEVARVMELETVAEYVQDEASVNLLRELGIDWGQGYYLGQPVALEEHLMTLKTDKVLAAV